MDLPVWQRLYSELREQGLVVIAVAMDSRGAVAARPWIEQAHPEYPCLIDQHHVVSELYHMRNVPQAVWINEAFRIVRPTEFAGTNDAFRQQDRQTGAWTDESFAEMRRVRRQYLSAIRDWVANGDTSPYVWREDEAREHVRVPDESWALANAHFRIGEYLLQHGNAAEGKRFVERAKALAPLNWNIWRQAWDLEGGNLAAYWAKVDALGDERYSDPIEMPGLDA